MTKQGVVAHAFNASTGEAEAGWFLVYRWNSISARAMQRDSDLPYEL